ncbi:ATP synthase F0, A subunit [Leptospira inadai serovar Lyme str. 10]|uniref:ATP synthase subunit a n=2 Tax=Leptospira inadai serovar Lyme TaxID=293084 RepID=V6HP27_9LEPT|nr:F0F1 ATP synthase subunit A [Leptospira inadai]EQA38630.1 ATP synthase F0, A subunit [Leptospira inadai serovar Lyme str. 10]PNV72404.1 ATP synthase F0 subunit A [Leptospira inadai serovar Lyme]
MLKRLFAAILLLSALPAFASESAGEGFDLNEVLVHHLMDHAEFPLNIGGHKIYEDQLGFDPSKDAIFFDHHHNKRFHFVGGFDLHITRRVTMMWIVSFLLFVIFIPAARIISKNPLKVQGRFANVVETSVDFLKKDVVDSNMDGHGHGYYHYIFSLFFFILFCNLLGLIPPVGEIVELGSEFVHSYVHVGEEADEAVSSIPANAHHEPIWFAKVWNGITVTGDVSVTMTLALMTMALIYAAGFIYQGPKFVIHSVPNGVPWPLYFLMWPLEFIVSPAAKTFALTVRLLANMTAGHVIILALMGFIFQFRAWGIIPVSMVGAGVIYVLELFVAFLQAYVFALLTSLFVGLSMHRH